MGRAMGWGARVGVASLASLALSVGAFVACSSSPSGAGGADAGGGDAVADGPAGGDDGSSEAGPPAAAIVRSGSRLSARYIDGADGSRTFDGITDTKLSLDCSVRAADDGTERCLPTDTLPAVTLYADMSCTTRVAIADEGSCVAVKYAEALVKGTNQCAFTHVIYALASTTPVTTLYMPDGVGGCQPATPATGASYYALGAEVAPTDFVGFTLDATPLSSAVAVRTAEGDDGSRFPFFTQLVDVARKQPCAAGVGSDGQPRCVPSTTLISPGYADMTCGARVAYDQDCLVNDFTYDTSTAIAIEQPSDVCASAVTRAFPIGAARAPEDVYGKDPDGGACDQMQTSTRPLFDVGAEIAPAGFAPLSYGMYGTTRLAEKAYNVGGVPVATPVRTIDTTLGVECEFLTAEDGTTRCLPSYLSSLYTDMGCSQPIAVAADTCGDAKYVTVADDLTCATKYRVFAVGAKIDTPPAQLFVRTHDGCLATSPGDGTYYAVGAEATPDTFVAGTKNLH